MVHPWTLVAIQKCGQCVKLYAIVVRLGQVRGREAPVLVLLSASNNGALEVGAV